MSAEAKVPYAMAVYGQEEIDAVNAVLKNPKHLVAGTAVKEFEKGIAQLFGKPYGVMTNSGSSANLIAFEMANLPAGSEVITPILTFSTTLNPILQKGLIPIFADVAAGTYVIDPDQVETLITPQTKALMVPSLLGNLPAFDRLQEMARAYRLIFIEDSCDTVGATFAGRPTGEYTDISTTSFYASHIITAAGGGGMVCFHDKYLAQRALVMCNWGRQSTLFGVYHASEDIQKRFAGVIDGEPYDAKFLFTEIGYNFQPLELQAAFGLVQLRRLGEFAERRRQNFAELITFLQKYEEFFILPITHPLTRTNWLALPLTIRASAPFSRLEITRYLEEGGVQTRPIFTGNVLKQPAYESLSQKRTLTQGYPVTDGIMRRGFVIGCHHGLTREQLDYLKELLAVFLNKYL